MYVTLHSGSLESNRLFYSRSRSGNIDGGGASARQESDRTAQARSPGGMFGTVRDATSVGLGVLAGAAVWFFLSRKPRVTTPKRVFKLAVAAEVRLAA